MVINDHDIRREHDLRHGGIDIQTILTIAGFDPSSGAGITADLAVIAAHEFFGTSAITALTVQSTLGVLRTHVVAAQLLEETLDCLAIDLLPAAVKIGMLGSRENVEVVVGFLRQLKSSGRTFPIVLDPVIRSSSGRELLSPDGLEVLRNELLPLVDWVTPNLAELGALAKLQVVDPPSMEAAVAQLMTENATLNVVGTGGHFASADDFVASFEGQKQWLRAEKIVSRATHGTGCAFSTAMVCNLVTGAGPVAAAEQAKEYVAQAIRRAHGIGSGNGPLELLWPLRQG